MADHVLTPDQVALLADGRAYVEDHAQGMAVVLGSDRLILPVHSVERTVTALANLDSLLGAALSAVALYRRTHPWNSRGKESR
ncbi:hypothetical protein NI17_022085 [Thermobifida halotolerans]|uniref:Uncharacterized protein n=1 Tax=Thermobifida halotolerans TaxID=483545 RepID=A0A399G116_9ACTN|nr:hypothetical protein [Thermobifida halotolerans]UOE19381.1 hypothetical protein NI17_022085 [Thermobifida halotolerans]